MYRNESKKKTNRFKVSLSDYELNEIAMAVQIDGGEQAVIARELLVNWARNVIRGVREKQIEKQQPVTKNNNVHLFYSIGFAA